MASGVFNRPPPFKFYGPKALGRQANRQVAASIKAQQAPIKTAQAAADARAAAAQQAIQGFGLAAAGILRDSAARIPQVYRDTATAESGLAAGFSQQAGDAVRNQVATNQATIDRLAPGGQETAPNVQGMQDALYAGGGYIPGASNEAQAAAQETYGLEQPAIQVSQTQQDLMSAQAKQATDDQTYVQQMMTLAAQEPQLRTQIMQQLQANEMAKRSAYIQQQAQQLVNQRFGVTSRQAQERINVSRQQGNARLALSAANLRLSQSRQNLAVKKFLQQGGTIDASASHAAGYLIDHNGDPIMDKSGKRIPVASTGSGRTASGAYGVGSTKYGEAVRSVNSLIPTPRANPNYFAGSPNTPDAPTIGYKYFARPGVGTLVPGSGWFTNKPSEAAATPKRAGVSTFADGVNFLMNSYGLARPAARRALVAGGWKPTGQRPKK